MKKILISGSSSGIGRGLTERLIAEKISVIGLARQHKKFMPQTKHYIPYTVDFSNIAKLDSTLAAIRSLHDDIDQLVCCAGYGHFAELEQFSTPQIQNLLNVNFVSQALLIKSFLPMLKKRGKGKIVVLGSEAALAGAKKGSIYCASKFALRGFCQSLRQECKASGISVTIVNPGLVRTPFFDALDFTPGEEDRHAMMIDNVVDAILLALNTPTHCVIEEINLQPISSQVKRK